MTPRRPMTCETNLALLDKCAEHYSAKKQVMHAFCMIMC